MHFWSPKFVKEFKFRSQTNIMGARKLVYYGSIVKVIFFRAVLFNIYLLIDVLIFKGQR